MFDIQGFKAFWGAFLFFLNFVSFSVNSMLLRHFRHNLATCVVIVFMRASRNGSNP